MNKKTFNYEIDAINYIDFLNKTDTILGILQHLTIDLIERFECEFLILNTTIILTFLEEKECSRERIIYYCEKSHRWLDYFH